MADSAPVSARPAPRVFTMPDTLLLAGFFLATAAACCDYFFPWPKVDLKNGIPIQELQGLFCWGFFALLLWADREPAAGRRLLATLAGLGSSLLLALVLRASVAGFPFRKEISLSTIVNGISFLEALAFWAVAFWMASPVLLGRNAMRQYSQGLRVASWALMVYGALCFASAFASQDPESSLLLFYRERALTFAILFAWIRAVHDAPALRGATARWIVGLLLAMVLLGALVGLADFFGSAALRTELADKRGFMLVERIAGPKRGPAIINRRLVFPMLHHNRTAYLALVLAMTLLTAACASARRRLAAILCLAGLAPAFFVMVLSYTRGVTAAAVAGLCLWAALVSRRALIVILAGCIIVAVALPARQREHFKSIFKAETYRIDYAHMTSMGLRMLGWQYGLGITRQMPLAGLGYGTSIVKKDYIRYITAKGDKRLLDDAQNNSTLQHMHNLWLEIAVESGLPALLAFIAFTVARWVMLGRAFLRAVGAPQRRLAAWVAFELAVLIAGTIYYMLKQNFGMINFFVWGYLLVELEALHRESAAQADSMLQAPEESVQIAC